MSIPATHLLEHTDLILHVVLYGTAGIIQKSYTLLNRIPVANKGHERGRECPDDEQHAFAAQRPLDLVPTVSHLAQLTMTLLARASAPLRQAAKRAPASTPMRFAHGHGVYQHLPFDGKKKTFGLKVAAYLIGGFAIPFGAATYQLKKSGAA